MVVYHKATNTLMLQFINKLFMKMIKSGRVSLSHGFLHVEMLLHEKNTKYAAKSQV